uniref:Uncharacterized protein n=1 Tax=Opuntia streptacantha TaxID=393608 RepID=A0A7C9D5S9_OPUST
MKKPPDPPLNPSPRTPLCNPQRPFLDFLVASVFQPNLIASFSASHHFVAPRDEFVCWVGNLHPLIPHLPDPQHLPSSCIHCCLVWSLFADYNQNQVQYPWFDSG